VINGREDRTDECISVVTGFCTKLYLSDGFKHGDYTGNAAESSNNKLP